jgi:prevent-host-death family protein
MVWRRELLSVCLDMDYHLVHLGPENRVVFSSGVGAKMQISVTEAKGQLTDLVRRAEAGDEIILTRHGQAAVRLVPIKRVLDASARRSLLEAMRKSGVARATAGPDAARSQDFLYGDDGLPE